MMSFPKNVETVAFAGDWHGDKNWATKMIDMLPDKVDVLVHLGDFGYRFEKNFMKSVDEAARDRDIIVMFVDGNHEDFDQLYSKKVDDDGVRRMRERIWHLPRGFRWEWSGVTFMALGGAHSIDRSNRVPNYSWWSAEHLTFEQINNAIEGGSVDVMVTHDAPLGHVIPGLGGVGFFPEADLISSEGHRRALSLVVDEVRPSFLWHGHYHSAYKERNGSTVVTGLDCDGSSFDRNVEVVNMKELREKIDEYHRTL